MAWKVRKGAFVHYRVTTGKPKHALVTAVTNQTTVNLRLGRGATKQLVTGATLVSGSAHTTGWFR